MSNGNHYHGKADLTLTYGGHGALGREQSYRAVEVTLRWATTGRVEVLCSHHALGVDLFKDPRVTRATLGLNDGRVLVGQMLALGDQGDYFELLEDAR